MAKELFYEDVEVGTEIPPLVKKPTTQQLVKWAGASGDFWEAHYDKDYALGVGFPGVVVHGKLRTAFLMQMIEDWIGVNGTLRKISVQQRGMDVPGDTLTCTGVVKNKYVKDGEHCVECDIWTENQKGERTVPGTATVVLPSRG